MTCGLGAAWPFLDVPGAIWHPMDIDTDKGASHSRVPDPIDREVGARMRLERQARGLTQQNLAERLGVSFQQIQKYERGINRISASVLVKAAEALGCSPALLLTGSERQEQAAGLEWTRMLSQPGARELLAAFVQIPDVTKRNALISVVTGLSPVSGASRS